MEFRPPSYNRSATYSIAAFYDHSLQSLMAVFIAKTPSLATDLSSVAPADRQNYFFYRFRKFADAYVNMALDDDIYFGSTSKEKAGTQGGGGKFFAERDKRQQSFHAEKIKYFEQKFKSSISGERDQRLFLGYNQIWNRIITERETILAPYAGSIASAYDDESFTTPFPDKLDKYLVPFTIRNKVVQKWTNARHRVVPREEPKEEEDPPKSVFKVTPVIVDDEDW